jgi:hypothetical protein
MLQGMKRRMIARMNREDVQKVAETSGMSVSSVYKWLNNPMTLSFRAQDRISLAVAKTRVRLTSALEKRHASLTGSHVIV